MYRTVFGYSLTDDTADSLVDSEHIEENATELRKVEAADRGAGRNIRLQDIRKNLNVVVNR